MPAAEIKLGLDHLAARASKRYSRQVFGHRSTETTSRYGNKHFDPANSPGLAISAAYADAAAEHLGGHR